MATIQKVRSEMFALEANRLVFVVMGITAPKRTHRGVGEKSILTFGVTMIFLASLATMASVTFVYQNLSVDLEEALSAVFQVSGLCSSIYIMTTALVKRRSIAKIFTRTQQIYDACSHQPHFDVVVKAHFRGENITNFLMKYAFGASTFSTIPAAIISVLYCYFVFGELKTETLYIPLKYSFPWSQSTVLGWISELTLGIIITAIFLLINTAFITFFIAICITHVGFYKFFITLIDNVYKEALSNRPKNDFRTKVLLCDSIRFHIAVKRLFQLSSNFYSNVLFILLISSMIVSACTLFQMDLALKHPSVDICFILLTISTNLLNLLLYCYNGKQTTDTYAAYALHLFQSRWFELPARFQKYVLMMICNAQQPMFYHGFGIVRMNLETFTGMLKTVVSYYMMFKSVTN